MMRWLERSSGALFWCGLLSCSTAQAPRSDDTPSAETVTPGFPDGVERIEIRLNVSQVTECHGTLVHPRWILTAAHCLSGVRTHTTGRLVTFERFFQTQDTWFHPSARSTGETRMATRFDSDEIVAAHDLALIRLDAKVTAVPPVPLWRTDARDEQISEQWTDVEVWLGRSRVDEAETVRALAEGLIPASRLLGSTQIGTLLAASGAAVLGGDSGTGLLARAPDEGNPADAGALFATHPGATALIGVVQNANPEHPRALFGIVPTWRSEHADWIAATIRDNTPPIDVTPEVTLDANADWSL